MSKTTTKICIFCLKEIPHNRSKRNNKYFCDSFCQQGQKHKEYINRWQKGLEDGKRGERGTSAHLKKYLLKKYDNKCSRCGWNKINPTTNKKPLHLEHIDGNWKNNKEENLTILCPNCHSLTSTFGSLNKGNGRPGRMKQYYKGKSY